jgi:hypothetical protein
VRERHACDFRLQIRPVGTEATSPAALVAPDQRQAPQPPTKAGATLLTFALHYSHCIIRTVCAAPIYPRCPLTILAVPPHSNPLPTGEKEIWRRPEASSRHSKAAGQVSSQRLCLRPRDVPSSRIGIRRVSDAAAFAFRPSVQKRGTPGPTGEEYVPDAQLCKRRFCGDAPAKSLPGVYRLKCQSESA